MLISLINLFSKNKIHTLEFEDVTLGFKTIGNFKILKIPNDSDGSHIVKYAKNYDVFCSLEYIGNLIENIDPNTAAIQFKEELDPSSYDPLPLQSNIIISITEQNLTQNNVKVYCNQLIFQWVKIKSLDFYFIKYELRFYLTDRSVYHCILFLKCDTNEEVEKTKNFEIIFQNMMVNKTLNPK